MNKKFDFSERQYRPGDVIHNAEIISILGGSWNGRFDTFWRLQLQFRDALEKHLRGQGIKVTCRIVPGGDGVEICIARDALKYQSRRRKSGCRKIKKAMDGLQQGVDPNGLTSAEAVKLDREQRIAVNQYLALSKACDFRRLLTTPRPGEVGHDMTR